MVIGGSASIVGSILGGAFYVLVPQLTNLVDPSLTALLQGAILLVVLFLLPGGLVSLPRALTRGRRRSPADARPCRATYHSVVDHRVGHRGGGTRNREARSRMKSHSRSRTAFRVVAGASALALMLAGCGGRGGNSEQRVRQRRVASPGITDTSLTLGITTPLSGATAGPGTCTVAGVKAYFGAKNAAGGIKFGDGKTRKVDIKALDDAYDPQKAKANYDQLKDGVFAMTAGLGTPTNRAWRQAAIADKVPQVLVMTGDPIFSDQQAEPLAARLRAEVPERGRGHGQAAGHLDRAAQGRDPVAERRLREGLRRGLPVGHQGQEQHPGRQAADLRGDRHLGRRADHRARLQRRRRLLQRDVGDPAHDLVAAEGAAAQLEAQLVPALQHLQPGCDPRARRRLGLPRHLLRLLRQGAGEPGLRQGPRRHEVPGGPQAVRQLPGPAGVPALPVELDGRRDPRPGLPEDDGTDP